ncbi:MAG: hypothetical protein R3290_13600 [Acidimicrobiia bacterium]|nr:hypothetical protein [Acidimicrobiia bacterium]
MASDRENLETVMGRLRNAVERGTGTSLDADEVRTVGTFLYALISSMAGGPVARRACGVCGGGAHEEEYIEPWGRHEYQDAVLVPLPEQPEE